MADHLTEEAALLMQSGELDAPDQVRLEEHLRRCAACRELYEQVTADLETAQAAIFSRSCVSLRQGLDSRPANPPGGSRRIVGLASMAACAGGLLFLFSSFTERLSANELIERAIREQSKAGPSSIISVRSAGVDCSAVFQGRPMAVTQSTACSSLKHKLETAHWNVNDPLSASSFRAWRSTLKRRTDQVVRRAGDLVLRTSTEEGTVHVATLAVLAETYHPISLRLEMEGAEPVEIEESAAPVLMTKTAAASEPDPMGHVESPTGAQPAPVPVGAPDPLDGSGVEVWTRLHRLHADIGFETVVTRTPDGIEIFGLVADEPRAEQIRAALQNISHVRVVVKTYASFAPGDDARFPVGEIGNSLPPLASEWLKEHFPGTDGRRTFVDAAGSNIRTLVGLSATLEQIRPFVPLAKDSRLLDVQTDIENSGRNALVALRESLADYMSACGGSLPAITSERARAIDSAFTRLMIAARDASNTESAETERLRSALGCKGE